MAEYIEREVALDVVKRTSGDYAAAWSEIAHMPAADVAEVRHGRWIGIEYDGYADGCPVYDLVSVWKGHRSKDKRYSGDIFHLDFLHYMFLFACLSLHLHSML